MLAANVTNDTYFLHWKQPYILDGLHIDLYLVTINVTSMASLAPILIQNTTYPESYQFSQLPNGSCTNYHICVQAEIIAGLGEPACIEEGEIEGNYKRSKMPH